MKKIIYITIPIIIIISIGIFMFRRSTIVKPEESNIIPTPSVVFPTISSDIKIDLIPRGDKKALTLKISKIPALVDSIDYEITYTTGTGLNRGMNGSIKTDGKQEVVRSDDSLTLGSCSTGGKCSFDTGVISVDLALKFNTSAGSSVFRKTYSI